MGFIQGQRDQFSKNITILNMYSPNNRASDYVRQKLVELQEELEKSTITVGDLNTTLSEMDRSDRHKINKDIVELNSTISQLLLIGNCRQRHPPTSF